MAETTLSPRIGSAGILVEDGKLMMGLSKKWGQWVLPGGKIDFMESYKDAVVREIREETGLDVVWEKFADVDEVLYPPTHNHRVLLYSYVRRIGGTMQPGDDIAEVRFFDRDELNELRQKNLLTGVMIRALTRFAWLDALAEAA